MANEGNYRLRYFFHLASTAFRAISDRVCAESFAARAFPPFDAPSFERATAAAFFFFINGLSIRDNVMDVMVNTHFFIVPDVSIFAMGICSLVEPVPRQQKSLWFQRQTVVFPRRKNLFWWSGASLCLRSNVFSRTDRHFDGWRSRELNVFRVSPHLSPQRGHPSVFKTP
jgi:hypothetical protein